MSPQKLLPTRASNRVSARRVETIAPCCGYFGRFGTFFHSCSDITGHTPTGPQNRMRSVLATAGAPPRSTLDQIPSPHHSRENW